MNYLELRPDERDWVLDASAHIMAALVARYGGALATHADLSLNGAEALLLEWKKRSGHIPLTTAADGAPEAVEVRP